MKKRINLPKTSFSMFAVVLVMLANVVTYSGSFLFFGEPKAPESLLK